MNCECWTSSKVFSVFQAGGVCFDDPGDLPDDNAELYRVNFGVSFCAILLHLIYFFD